MAVHVGRMVDVAAALQLVDISSRDEVETLDWVSALVALDRDTLDPEAVAETMGVVLKSKDDLDALRGERLATVLARAATTHRG